MAFETDAVRLRRPLLDMTGRLLCMAVATAVISSTAAAQTPAPAAAASAPPVAVSPEGYPKAILRGDYADPTIMRDGKDYYMTHSPFGYAPAFLIWHSTDLLHWTPIARAMPGSANAYAPDLLKHNGKFYIYYPSAQTNWVITADNIKGPWTAPIDLKVPKIDPGHAVGEDGKRYLFTSGGRRVQLTDDGLAAVGESKEVYTGWKYPTEWETECMCLESPKLFKKGEYFYKVSAQGGTAGPATSHMSVVARSKSINGPWENSPYNPLVHTYSAEEQWWSKGHGTIIDDVNGNWWVVNHAYEKGGYTLGRMTILDPIDWNAEGWPVLAKKARPLPGSATGAAAAGMPLSDTFSGDKLGLQWTSWRDVNGVAVKDGALHLTAKGTAAPSARQLLITAPDQRYEVQVEVTVPEEATGGLILVYNDRALVGVTSDGNTVSVYRSATDIQSQPSQYGRHFFLKITNDAERATFAISRDGRQWAELASKLDVSGLNHNAFRGFLALRPALAAYGKGEVKFDNFQYRTLK